ncbi:MAG: hypothetical protein ACFHHU_02330 [Porticoccaceae bacterium]
MSDTKKNRTLGENRGFYKAIIYLLPVMPAGLFVFIWFLWPKNFDLLISSFIVLTTLVFLYQTYEIVCFLMVAGKTVFKLKIEAGEVDIELFSGRRLHLFAPLNIKNFDNRSVKHGGKLFPKSVGFMQINAFGETFFISSTTDDFKELRDQLKQNSR